MIAQHHLSQTPRFVHAAGACRAYHALQCGRFATSLLRPQVYQWLPCRRSLITDAARQLERSKMARFDGVPSSAANRQQCHRQHNILHLHAPIFCFQCLVLDTCSEVARWLLHRAVRAAVCDGAGAGCQPLLHPPRQHPRLQRAADAPHGRGTGKAQCKRACTWQSHSTCPLHAPWCLKAINQATCLRLSVGACPLAPATPAAVASADAVDDRAILGVREHGGAGGGAAGAGPAADGRVPLRRARRPGEQAWQSLHPHPGMLFCPLQPACMRSHCMWAHSRRTA